MKKLLSIGILFCLLIFVGACKNGQKLYQKGRYDEAVTVFVKKLQKKTQDPAALAYLPKAYSDALDWHEDRVDRILASNDELKWESVKREYQALQSLYLSIQSSPVAKSLVAAKDYSSAIRGAQENGAQVRYDRGLYFMDQGTKRDFRQAYEEFDAALRLVPNFKDAQALRDEAYELGIIRVEVSRIDVRSPYFQFTADYFRDALVRNLQQRNIDPFVRFYDERQVSQERVPVDQYLDMHFYDFIVGQTYVEKTERPVQKEHVVVGKRPVRDSTGKTHQVDVYGTAKATIYIVRKTIVSKALFDYAIIDTKQNTIITNNRIPGSFTWVNEYATFKGDERALGDEDKKLIGGSDIAPPDPQSLFLEVTRPIYDQLERDLRSFYSRY
ncbi:hypothetical protein COR50_15980 [Chitinophaga caeni]|uniref:Uncharacterized protein n=1 Tax=Chitinophaga caeni TaxID=2029983 RepID=A0A291QWY5_9BACT|nr:hypothetical protein [Chitinophaga caeni]ATL48539.1 hypothetical protein COR50_15980 [Chitinophaga caeni]